MRTRLTILGLMGVIAYIAVGMAAIRTNDDLWAAVVLGLTVAVLCTATLMAIYRRGAWAGFSVFGWAYFWVCQPHAAPPPGPTTLPMRLVCWLASSHQKGPGVDWPTFHIPGYQAIGSDYLGKPQFIFVSGRNSHPLGPYGALPLYGLRSALCLTNMLVGLVGAMVGSLIARYAILERDEGESRSEARIRRNVVS